MEGHEFHPPISETETVDHQQTVINALKRSYLESAARRTLPRVERLVDQSGNALDRRVGERGQIEEVILPQEEDLILDVATDSGVITDADTELITKEVTGCLAIFLRGKKNKMEVIVAGCCILRHLLLWLGETFLLNKMMSSGEQNIAKRLRAKFWIILTKRA